MIFFQVDETLDIKHDMKIQTSNTKGEAYGSFVLH